MSASSLGDDLSGSLPKRQRIDWRRLGAGHEGEKAFQGRVAENVVALICWARTNVKL
jgi:hypothetical protein